MDRKELIKSKDVLKWWRSSGETTKKGKSDYRTPINVEEPNVEREQPERGEIYRRLQKIVDLYRKVVIGVSPILRKQMVHDEEAYLGLLRTLEQHIENKIRQERKSKKPYIQIGDYVRLYGDVDGYNAHFKGTQIAMNKILRAIANELNLVAHGEQIEKDGNTILFSMKEETWLDYFKGLLEHANLEHLNDSKQIITYINRACKERNLPAEFRYTFLEWIEGKEFSLILEDLPSFQDTAYKNLTFKRPSMGSFPYSPDVNAMGMEDQTKDRAEYAFGDALTRGIDFDDELAQILQVHNMRSQITDEEEKFIGHVKALTGFEPIVIGSKALGTAVEGGVSDLDLFIGAPDEQAFEQVSNKLQQILNPSSGNDTMERHPQLRVFNAEDKSKQVGVGYGPDAQEFVQSVIEATLRLDEPTRDAIQQAKIDAANVKDSVKKSQQSLKDALDALLGIKRMEAPIDESTGVYAGGMSGVREKLPPEQQGKRKVHWDNEPGINSPVGLDQPAPGDYDRSDAIIATDVHKNPSVQNHVAKMTGNNASRNDAQGFVNSELQDAESEAHKAQKLGRALNFSNTEEMDFEDIEHDESEEQQLDPFGYGKNPELPDDVADYSEPGTVKKFRETVDNEQEKSRILGNKGFEKMQRINYEAINKFYNVGSQLQMTTDSTLKAHYDMDNDTIYINSTMAESYEDLLASYLHEVCHAIKAKQVGGGENLKELYEQEISTFQANNPGNEDDWYASHSQEIEAEAFAKKELTKWL